MRIPLALLAALVIGTATVEFPAAAWAHPGSGIVVDRAGNVYFVRAGQNVVWKLSVDGRLTKHVDNDIVRLPHHLTLGKDGTLYMASDYDGRIWRVGADGTLTEQFNTNRIEGTSSVNVGSWGDPWTIDSAGRVYALAAPNSSALVRITNDGKVAPLAKNVRFGELHFSTMTLGADGALYLTDANRVWRIVGDSAAPIIARGVSLDAAAGVAVDSAGNIYVADFGARRVVRLSQDGAVNTPPALARLSLSNPWGVTIAPEGSIYVLDHLSNGQGVAVWRLRGERAEQLYAARDAGVYLISGVLTLLPLLFAIQTVVRKPGGLTDWVVWTAVVGVVVVGLWWMARGAFAFSWMRHFILAIFLYGAWRSWPRRVISVPIDV